MGGKGVVDLTDEDMGGERSKSADVDDAMLGGLLAALKEKQRERKAAERVLRALEDEENDLQGQIQAMEEKEANESRERNRPDWAKQRFAWDAKVQELLTTIFKLPHFRPKQREVSPCFLSFALAPFAHAQCLHALCASPLR